MDNDNGRLNFSSGIDNSQLKADAEDAKNIFRGITATAVKGGTDIDKAFKNIGTPSKSLASLTMANIGETVGKTRKELEQAFINIDKLSGEAFSTLSDKAKQLTREIQEDTLMLSRLETMQEALNDTYEKGGISLNDYIGAQARLSVLHDQVANAIRDNEQALRAEISTTEIVEDSISSLQAKVSLLTVEYMNLSKAQREGTAGQSLLKNLTDIQNKLAQATASMNQYARSTGAKFDGLSFSIQQIARELPVLAMSPQMFFLAISNNLPIFADEIAKAKKEYQLLTEAGRSSTPVWKRVLSSMFSWQTALVGGITLLTVYGDEITKWIGSLFSADKAQSETFQNIEEWQNKVSESAGNTISDLEWLALGWSKLGNDMQAKQRYILENKNAIDGLGVSINDVTDAERVFNTGKGNFIEAVMARAQAAATMEIAAEEYKKAVQKMLEADAMPEKKTYKYSTATNVIGLFDKDSWKTVEYDNPDKIKAEKEANDYLQSYVNLINKSYEFSEEARKKLEENGIQLNDNLVDGSVKAIRETIRLKEEALENVTNPEDYRKIEAEILAERAKLEAITGKNNVQKISDEIAVRIAQINEYSDKVSEAVRQAELDIRQAEIDAMEEGYNKAVAQVNLNYDRLIAENKKRTRDMLNALADKKVLEWRNANPKASTEEELAYRASLNLTVADLSPEQQSVIMGYENVADDIRRKGNKDALDAMLADVMTYEQQRLKITEEYEEKRKQLYKTDDKGNYVVDANGNRQFREGVIQGNVDEVNRQEEGALQRVDEQFAQREATYRAWCNEIAKMTLEELERTLDEAETALTEAQNNGTSGTELAEARAKVQTAKNQLSKVKENDTRPDKRSIEEWNDLREALEDCVSAFEEIGNTVGDVAGEIISTAGQISTSSISMINGIVQLTNMSTTSISKTATAAATAISMVEKASVILTIISAAIQIVMKIVDLFNKDDEHQEKIDSLQSQIDQLQWEIDNIDISTFQSKVGTSMDLMKKSIAQARVELMMAKYNVGDLQGAFDVLVGKYKYDSEVLSKSIQKLSDNFANLEYSSTNALGDEKYLSGREQLEKYSEQILLTKKQIDEESQKKDPNKEQIDEWNRQIEELGNEAASVINEMVDEIIGGSAAEIANELGDAFFEAARQGEDAMKAWGEKADEIVSDIIKRMLISEFLEKPLGDIFEEYKNRWFKDGNFLGFDSVKGSMADFSNEINSLVGDFSAGMDGLPDELKEIILGNAEEQTREATEKGIATASQDSVDELNGRATSIQGHTYEISENMKMLLTTSNLILQSVLNIEDNTDDLSSRMANVESDMRVMRNTVNDMNLKGIKIKY